MTVYRKTQVQTSVLFAECSVKSGEYNYSPKAHLKNKLLLKSSPTLMCKMDYFLILGPFQPATLHNTAIIILPHLPIMMA